MHEYETLRQRHAADAMRWAPGMIDRLDWSADRLAAYRVERLRAIVRHAVKHSPWHRDRLAEVDLGRLDGQFLRDIPPMTKSDLMGDFDQIVTDPRLTLERVNRHLETVDINGYLLDRYSAIASGGSSGERGAGRVRLRLGGVGDLRFVRDPALLRAKQADPELSGRPAVIAWVMAGRFTHATAAIGRTFAGPHLVTHRQTSPHRLLAALSCSQFLATRSACAHRRVSANPRGPRWREARCQRRGEPRTRPRAYRSRDEGQTRAQDISMLRRLSAHRFDDNADHPYRTP
jgi:hypothetical protein